MKRCQKCHTKGGNFMKASKKLTCRVKHIRPPEQKIIMFDKSALPALCEMLKVSFDPNIIAFTKEGVFKNNIADVIKLADKLK